MDVDKKKEICIFYVEFPSTNGELKLAYNDGILNAYLKSKFGLVDRIKRIFNLIFSSEQIEKVELEIENIPSLIHMLKKINGQHLPQHKSNEQIFHEIVTMAKEQIDDMYNYLEVIKIGESLQNYILCDTMSDKLKVKLTNEFIHKGFKCLLKETNDFTEALVFEKVENEN